ncbi:hypothetical protein J6590_055085 [Homalodisca vitripennis]|nr:hypothetical protein J6590_055085 [Homalodisca vitripennis]
MADISMKQVHGVVVGVREGCKKNYSSHVLHNSRNEWSKKYQECGTYLHNAPKKLTKERLSIISAMFRM